MQAAHGFIISQVRRIQDNGPEACVSVNDLQTSNLARPTRRDSKSFTKASSAPEMQIKDLDFNAGLSSRRGTRARKSGRQPRLQGQLRCHRQELLRSPPAVAHSESF